MRTYDITLTITPDLVVWPEDPPISIERVSNMEEGADANVTHIKMSAHTGTHVDAPYHFIKDGSTVEDIPIRMLTGRAYVVHFPDAELITAAMLEKSPIPPRTRRVLIRTSNSEMWAEPHKTFNEKYVAVAPDAAEYLIQKGVKLIGVDYLSVAPYSDLVTTHQILLKAGLVIVEGLNLSEVEQGRYTLYCLPLKLGNSDGAPARAILIGV